MLMMSSSVTFCYDIINFQTAVFYFNREVYTHIWAVLQQKHALFIHTKNDQKKMIKIS